MANQNEMTLRCFNSKCNKVITFEINRLPEFGIDLMNITAKVGWVSALDLPHSRTLVFCSDECRKKSQTKIGGYKLRG